MKFLKAILAGALVIGAGSALADTTVANTKVGAEYRAGYSYDDVAKTGGVGLDVAKLNLNADLNSSSKFSLLYNAAAAQGQDALQVAQVSTWLTHDFGVSVGKGLTNIGGWDQKELESQNLLPSAYAGAAALPKYAASAALNVRLLGGVLILQGVNDTAASKAQGQQLASLAEWHGQLGNVAPILQYGTYEGANGSSTGTVGAKVSLGQVTLGADLTRDQRKSNSTDYDTATASASVDLGCAAPFAKLSYGRAKTDGQDAGERSLWNVGTTVGGDSKVRPFVGATGSYNEQLAPGSEAEQGVTRSGEVGLMGSF